MVRQSKLINEVTWLRDDTRERLLHRPASLSISEIANKTGISTAWLHAFSRGEISNPGVVTIETLNVFLKQLAQKV